MNTKEKLTEIIGNVVVNDKGNRIRDVFHPEFVEKIVDALMSADGYRKQEWISVKDALPEDEQTVLTIDTGREMQVCFYETAQKGVFQLFHGLVSVYNITHWMPLPEPPKEKGGAE